MKIAKAKKKKKIFEGKGIWLEIAKFEPADQI